MVKMDCEGCEAKSLPVLAKDTVSPRVRRLAGELHLPDQNLEEIACRWDHGRLLSKCGDGECGLELSCDSAAASGAGDEEPDKAGDEEASAFDGDDDSDVDRYASEANVADNSSSSDNDDDSDVDRYASEANVADNSSSPDNDDDSNVDRYVSEANVADNSSSPDNDDDSDVDRYASEANVADN